MAEAQLILGHENSDTIKYTNAAAATAGEVISITGIGAAIAHDTYDAADANGVYYIKGIFSVPLESGENPTQGTEVYWDVSSNKARAGGSASITVGDFYLGRAVKNATVSGGYVEVELNAELAADNVYDKVHIVGSGIHTWATTGAVTDSLTILGVTTNDVIQWSMMTQGASTPAGVLAYAIGASSTVAITADRNGEIGVTKIGYTVFRDAV